MAPDSKKRKQFGDRTPANEDAFGQGTTAVRPSTRSSFSGNAVMFNPKGTESSTGELLYHNSVPDDLCNSPMCTILLGSEARTIPHINKPESYYGNRYYAVKITTEERSILQDGSELAENVERYSGGGEQPVASINNMPAQDISLTTTGLPFTQQQAPKLSMTNVGETTPKPCDY